MGGPGGGYYQQPPMGQPMYGPPGPGMQGGYGGNRRQGPGCMEGLLGALACCCCLDLLF
jgi:hypothetical protein